MPRETRFSLVAIPQHIVQRGSGHGQCFYADEDYVFFLACLKEAARSHGCRIHAYVLLPDHVHLLGTPRTRNGFMGMMQTLRDQYAHYVKRTYRRATAPWAGRYQACVVQADRTLLEVYRYIELHPARSALAQHPANYRWSSHAHHALGVADELITEHAQYLRLGPGANEHYQAYRELLRQPMDPRTIDAIRRATAMEGVLGDEVFARQITMAVKHRMMLPERGITKRGGDIPGATRPAARE